MIGFTSRSTSDLPTRMEALSEAVELSVDRLDEEQVAFARHVVEKASARLRHGTTRTLVAVLGATGSGKSSVTNTIVGDDVATTGVRRPTTSSTMGCYWGAEDAQALLDWLEIKNRHDVQEADGSLDGLVLLDVPDHDSVAEAHRLEMERIAEHADMLLWVTDPEKYGDKAMHDYLKQLSGHGAVMALAINKSDQLTGEQMEQCRLDLKRLLDEVGLDRAPVITMSALTGDNVDTLRALLVDTVKGQQAVIDRLNADTTMAADALIDELGPAKGADEVPGRVAKDLSRELVAASGLHTVTDAVAAGYKRDAARKTGWPFSRWLRRLRPHPLGRFHLNQQSGGRTSLPEPSGVQQARAVSAVRDAAASISEGMPAPWPDLVLEAGTPEMDVLHDRMDSALADSVRTEVGDQPRWWVLVNGLQILLAAAVVVGAVWLGLLAVAAYLRIPELPTPDYRGIPIPTGLLVGGVALGLLVAFLAARLVSVGANRRSRAVRRKTENAVRDVADELIIEPIQRELDSRRDLRSLLVTAKGRG